MTFFVTTSRRMGDGVGEEQIKCPKSSEGEEGALQLGLPEGSGRRWRPSWPCSRTLEEAAGALLGNRGSDRHVCVSR